MKIVLGVATILGVAGVISSFGLLYIGETLLKLPLNQLQTMMYLKLSVAGHLTVFIARTRGPFWSIKPSRILLFAVIGTQIAATFIAVYGFLMGPLGWKYAGLVWGYAFVELFVVDIIKLGSYKVFGQGNLGWFGRHVRNGS